MSKKIFITYKYSDSNVQALSHTSWLNATTTVRDYVDNLQRFLDKNDHINKGEQDGEDLSSFKIDTIASKLRDKIWDSSLTIILISPNMKEAFKIESDQWIPWEISYSLKEHTRNGRTSKSNALLGVVIPDRAGSYSYFIQENVCSNCNCRIFNIEKTFNIIAKNMFNKKNRELSDCKNSHGGIQIFTGNPSYIEIVKWKDFVSRPNYYLNLAENIQVNIDDYNVEKTV